MAEFEVPSYWKAVAKDVIPKAEQKDRWTLRIGPDFNIYRVNTKDPQYQKDARERTAKKNKERRKNLLVKMQPRIKREANKMGKLAAFEAKVMEKAKAMIARRKEKMGVKSKVEASTPASE